MNAQRKAELVAELRAQLEELQLWFARKPYGFTEGCSAGQLQQYRDRETEQEHIVSRLQILAD